MQASILHFNSKHPVAEELTNYAKEKYKVGVEHTAAT